MRNLNRVMPSRTIMSRKAIRRDRRPREGNETLGPNGLRAGTYRNGMAHAKRRRSSTEVRRLLLAAAAGVFARRGFSGSRTADIAAKAGVSESTLFAHFPSKGDLFVAATLEAFVSFADEISAFLAEPPATNPADLENTVVHYVSVLFDHVMANREALLALLAGSTDPDSEEFTEAARQRFQAVLDDLTGVADNWTKGFGRTIPRLEFRVRLPIAMIVSVVLYDRWFLPQNGRFGNETIIRELAGQIIRGALSEERAPELTE